MIEMKVKEYIQTYKTVFIMAGLFSFLCFIYMLVTPGISIDEETWIQIEKPFAMWLVQGRWGIDIFNFISMDQGRYAPVMWDILAILTWNGAGILFSYTLFGEKAKKLPLFFFQAYLCSLPFVLGEMFSFSMFSFQIALGMLSTAAAFLYSVRAVQKRGWKNWIIALLFLIYAFSVYQAYICVYITAVAVYCFQAWLLREEDLLRRIASWAVVCVLGIVVYYGVHIILMKAVGTSSYLSDNYVGWFDEGGILKALFMAFANIVRVSLAIPIAGETVYGGEVIRIVTAAFLVYVVWQFIKEKGAVRKAGILFYAFVLTAAPFALFLVLGTYKTHGRVLLGLALAGGAQLYFILNSIKREHVKKAGIVASAYLLFLNAKNMNMLFYSANVAYEHDRTVANQVMYDIKKAGIDYHSKPIVFLGMEEMDDVGLPTSDTVGSSIFAWDDGNISRMCNFMKTEGYRVLPPDAAEIQAALKYKDQMKEWPLDGSILEKEDFIIVLFSEPSEKWYTINQVVQ